MDINLDRVLGRLEELYQCGAQEDGNIHPHGIFAGGQEGTGRSSWTISGSWE